MKKLINFRTENTYKVCVRIENGNIIDIGNNFWSLSSANLHMIERKALNEKLDYVVVKESIKYTLIKPSYKLI